MMNDITNEELLESALDVAQAINNYLKNEGSSIRIVPHPRTKDKFFIQHKSEEFLKDAQVLSPTSSFYHFLESSFKLKGYHIEFNYSKYWFIAEQQPDFSPDLKEVVVFLDSGVAVKMPREMDADSDEAQHLYHRALQLKLREEATSLDYNIDSEEDIEEEK